MLYILKRVIFYFICFFSRCYNGKRDPKWVPTGLKVKPGNKTKAESFLNELKVKYNKDSIIIEEMKKNSKKKKESNTTSKFQISDTNILTETEELTIAKCFASWFNTSKEDKVKSLVNIIQSNPNTQVITTIMVL